MMMTMTMMMMVTLMMMMMMMMMMLLLGMMSIGVHLLVEIMATECINRLCARRQLHSL
jgi:hypothetical protein